MKTKKSLRQTKLKEFIGQSIDRYKLLKAIVYVYARREEWVFDTHDLEYNFQEIIDTYSLHDLNDAERKALKEELKELAEAHQTKVVRDAQDDDHHDEYKYYTSDEDDED